MNLPYNLDDKYKYVETVNLKELGIRKKLTVLIVKDLTNKNSIIFHTTQKSRFLQKDVDKIEEIATIILKNMQYNIQEKIILIESALCSKAKDKLHLREWIVLG